MDDSREDDRGRSQEESLVQDFYEKHQELHPSASVHDTSALHDLANVAAARVSQPSQQSNRPSVTEASSSQSYSQFSDLPQTFHPSLSVTSQQSFAPLWDVANPSRLVRRTETFTRNESSLDSVIPSQPTYEHDGDHFSYRSQSIQTNESGISLPIPVPLSQLHSVPPSQSSETNSSLTSTHQSFFRPSHSVSDNPSAFVPPSVSAFPSHSFQPLHPSQHFHATQHSIPPSQPLHPSHSVPVSSSVHDPSRSFIGASSATSVSADHMHASQLITGLAQTENIDSELARDDDELSFHSARCHDDRNEMPRATTAQFHNDSAVHDNDAEIFGDEEVNASLPPLAYPEDSDDEDDEEDDSLLEEYDGQDIPAHERATILNMLRTIWSFRKPREFQVRAIHKVAYDRHECGRHRLGLIRRTGEGKSLVLLGIATLLRGLTVITEPLITVGSDQVASVTEFSSPHGRVYAFHLDAFSKEDAKEFGSFLYGLRSCSRHSIILYCSPDMLKPDTIWSKCIDNAMRHGFLNLLAVDEAHTIYYDGRRFRPVFKELGGNLFHKAWNRVPMVFASATMNSTCISFVEDCLRPPRSNDKLFTVAYWGHMRRREIDIQLTFAYNFNALMKETITPLLQSESDKFLIMTNSAMKATDTLVPLIEDLIQHLGVDGDIISLTGEDGIMLKAWLVDLFAGKITTPLCNLRGMPCTKAANCGISSALAKLLCRLDLPPNRADESQERGRVGRKRRKDGSVDVWRCFVNIDSYLQLVVRALNSEDKEEGKLQLLEHVEVMSKNVLPRGCYHESIEADFEPAGKYPFRRCINRCPHCRGEHLQFVGRIRRSALVNFLSASVLFDGPKAPKLVARKIRENAKDIWIEHSDVVAGHSHALVLQLLAARILELIIERPKKEGDPIKKEHIKVGWARTAEDDGPRRLRHTLDEAWEHINCANE